MSDLTRRALGTVPLSVETVQSFWDGTRSGTPEQCLRSLCISHERLRADLQGAEILLAENEARINALKGFREILRTLLDRKASIHEFHDAVKAVISDMPK